jgi:GTP cyclohydrolase III
MPCSDVLKILRKILPDHSWPEDFVDDNVRDLSTVQNQRGAELLKSFGGRGGHRLRSRWRIMLRICSSAHSECVNDEKLLTGAA